MQQFRVVILVTPSVIKTVSETEMEESLSDFLEGYDSGIIEMLECDEVDVGRNYI